MTTTAGSNPSAFIRAMASALRSSIRLEVGGPHVDMRTLGVLAAEPLDCLFDLDPVGTPSSDHRQGTTTGMQCLAGQHIAGVGGGEHDYFGDFFG
jgi:hypothetical protein